MRITTAVCIGCIVAAPGTGRADGLGPGVKFTVGVHSSVASQFNLASAYLHFSNATKILNDRRPECGDTPVCVSLMAADGPLIAMPTSIPADLQDDTPDTSIIKGYLATATSPQIKVVRSIRIGQQPLGGVTDRGVMNAFIDVSELSDTWAHEFGHMCGLYDDNDCDYLIMRGTATYQYRFAMNPAEADIMASYSFLHGTPGTTSCDATGMALMEDISAVPGPGGVTVGFRTLWEVDTSSFEVLRIDENTSATLYSVGAPSLITDAKGLRYAISDPSGAEHDVYQIIEHQTDGRGDLVTGAVIAQPPQPSGAFASGYDPDSLAAVVSQYQPVSTESFLDPCTYGTTPEYAILSPDQFAIAAGSYAGLWQQHGVDARVVSEGTATSLCGGFQEYIREAVPHGLKYVLLLGDANDHALWDDSTLWVGNGWKYPSHWGWVGQIPDAHTPSQPLKDLLPTFYKTIPIPPRDNWTHYTPYFAMDLPYSDIDGDSLPDVIVGRLPISSTSDLNAYTAKLATWLTHTNRHFGTTAALLTYAVNHDRVPAWPQMVAKDSLRAAFGAGINVSEASYVYLGPPAWGYFQRDSLQSIANTAASGGAEVIVWNLNSSDRYENTGFWSAYDYDDWIPIGQTTKPFVSVGLSCGMNDFDRTEESEWTWSPPAGYQHFNYVRPIVEKILFDPGRGAIAQIGPTRASQILGNPIIGRAFLKRLYEPGSTVGRAFLLAQRQSMLEHPEYRDLFKSYVLLGDPRLGPGTVTGVGGAPPVERTQLLRPEPNPFNPVTRFRYYLEGPTRSSLTIFDIHGRVVRRLLREALRPPGWADVRWDGKTDLGHKAASGMYFARMQAGSASYVQRVVLLK